MQHESAKATDAVDPQASSTGKTTTRASCSHCSHLIAALRALEQEMEEAESDGNDGGPTFFNKYARGKVKEWRERLSSLTQQEKASTQVEHVCGLQGYQRGQTPDPICPACAAASLTGKE
jgi:hypothetical protein